jgi:hypothetical protein
MNPTLDKHRETMAPSSTTPPVEYSSVYCAAVHELCHTKMDAVKETVDDIHGAVFGSKEQPGLLSLMHQKVSTTTVRWLLSIFGIPIIAAALVIYAFYVKVPLTYTEKQEFNALQDQVVKIEEKVKQIPTATEMKGIVKEALKEHTPR